MVLIIDPRGNCRPPSERYCRTGLQKEPLMPAEDPVAAAERSLADISPSHPQWARRLSDLSLRLLSRYKQEHAAEDLARALLLGREAVAHARDAPEELANYRHNLALVLQASAEPGDLDEALDLVGASLSWDGPDGRRPLTVYLLSELLQDRFAATADRTDLDSAIAPLREVVDRTDQDAGRLFRPGLLSDLGRLLVDRYELSGDRNDLRESVNFTRDALAMIPVDDPDHGFYLANMDRVARMWTDNPRTDTVIFLYGSINDRIGAYLEDVPDKNALLAAAARTEAQLLHRESRTRPGLDVDVHHVLCLFHTIRFREVEEHQRAEEISLAAAAMIYLDDHAAPVEEYLRDLVNDGVEVVAAYAAVTVDRSLDEAAALLEPMVRLLPAGHPRRSSVLATYWEVHYGRYEQFRRWEDLDRAFEVIQETMALTADGEPNRSARLSKLATTLRSKFLQTGDPAHITAAVNGARESLAAGGPDDPDHAVRLESLCRVLTDRFELTGDQADIDEAVTAGRRALQMWAGAGIAEVRATLGAALYTHYLRHSNPAILDEAVDQMTEAVAELPADAPFRRVACANLAIARSARAERTGSHADLDGAIDAVWQAIDATAPDDAQRETYIAQLLELLKARY
jgi:tetratricopeptide (TPR) repeat protein